MPTLRRRRAASRAARPTSGARADAAPRRTRRSVPVGRRSRWRRPRFGVQRRSHGGHSPGRAPSRRGRHARRYRGVRLPCGTGAGRARTRRRSGRAMPGRRRDAPPTPAAPRRCQRCAGGRVPRQAPRTRTTRPGTWMIRPTSLRRASRIRSACSGPPIATTTPIPTGSRIRCLICPRRASCARRGRRARSCARRRADRAPRRPASAGRPDGPASSTRSGTIACVPTARAGRSCGSRRRRSATPRGSTPPCPSCAAGAPRARALRAPAAAARTLARQPDGARARHRRLRRRRRRRPCRRQRWTDVSTSRRGPRDVNSPWPCWWTSARSTDGWVTTTGASSTSRRRRCSSSARRSMRWATATASSPSPARAPTTCPCCR